MATPDLLLYTAKICPYAHRTELALAETGQNFERYEIDLFNKPEWYKSKVNEASKVPVLVIRQAKGGSDAYLPESLVVSEFVAEKYASGSDALLPDDPLDKARVRYVIERFSQLFAPGYGAAFRERNPSAIPKLLDALKQFQELLPPQQDGPYFLGNKYSLAEVAISPFIGRLLLNARSGFFPASDIDVAKSFLEDPSFARLQAWWSAVSSRPSWAKTFDEKTIAEQTKLLVAKLEGAAASA